MKKCRLPRSHIAWNKLKRLKEKVKEEVKIAKEKRLNKIVDKVNKGDTGDKLWWKLTRALYNRRSDVTGAPLVIDGVPVSDLATKADKFNEHFANISRIPGMDDPIPEETVYNENCPKLSEIKFTDEEVKNAMRGLKINSAPGTDLITNLALARTAETMSGCLRYLFNRSLSEGIMPDHWKQAHISPIHKGGDISNIQNYRPISLLLCPSKLLERLIYDRMVPFLEENGVFGDQQFGFRKGTGATDQLLELYNSMLQSLDNHEVKKMLFVDVSKAFDRVWRKGLAHKLQKAGIRGNLLKWMKSYLENRLQRCVIRGRKSSWLEVLEGVPQGSILGPILYLIYAEDMKDNLATDIRTFADDTMLSATAATEELAVRKLQPEIARMNAMNGL